MLKYQRKLKPMSNKHPSKKELKIAYTHIKGFLPRYSDISKWPETKFLDFIKFCKEFMSYDCSGILGWKVNKANVAAANEYKNQKENLNFKEFVLRIDRDKDFFFYKRLCQFATTNGAVAPPPTPLPADTPGGEPSIFAALQKQLGLKLNKVKALPLDMIVVDHVEKTPTAN